MIKSLQFAFIYSCIAPEDTELNAFWKHNSTIPMFSLKLHTAV